jgi:hypothetical protein
MLQELCLLKTKIPISVKLTIHLQVRQNCSRITETEKKLADFYHTFHFSSTYFYIRK